MGASSFSFVLADSHLCPLSILLWRSRNCRPFFFGALSNLLFFSSNVCIPRLLSSSTAVWLHLFRVKVISLVLRVETLRWSNQPPSRGARPPPNGGEKKGKESPGLTAARLSSLTASWKTINHSAPSIIVCVCSVQEVWYERDRKFERPSSSCNGWPGPARGPIKAHWPRPLSLFIPPLWTPRAITTVARQRKMLVFFLFWFLVQKGHTLFDPTIRSCRFDLYFWNFSVGKKVTFDWSVWTIRIRVSFCFIYLFFFSILYSTERIEFELPTNRAQIWLPLVDLTQRTEK